jgi:hypothetical protein
MTIAGWILFLTFAAMIAVVGGGLAYVLYDYNHKTFATLLLIIGTLICIAGIYAGMHWYYKNTASGQRALVDQGSNLKGGLERKITIYTADGEILAEYEGKIDIETNDGGYIKFDLDGKRYIYYNCFVESIADIK